MLISLALAATITAPLAIPLAPRGQDVIGIESLDALLESIRAEHGLPALAGAIVSGPDLVGIGAVGKRRMDAELQVTTDDLWHLGSCTKSMTATWIARLVEDEEIDWDTTLGDVYPDLVRSGAMHADWKDVRLELLLSNRSGAPRSLDAGGLWASLWRHEGTPAEQRRALVEGVLARAPEAEPGTRYIYSNAGFSIAAAMAETVLDEPYEERIQEDLFEPLNMGSVGFGAPGERRPKGKKVRRGKRASVTQPAGHRTRDGKLVPVEFGPGDDNPSAIAPAGKVHGSLGDWARYASLHLAGARGESKFLTPETFERLHTPGLGNYAMGWMVRKLPWAEGPVIWHNGSNTMWYCEIAIVPEADCAVLVACNRAGGEARKAVGKALRGLYEHHAESQGD